MLDIEQLLQPLAGSNPCGIDLDYDSRFQLVKDLVENGTEEEPTDWKKVRKQCLELLNDGRNVELLVLLAASSVATEGYQGLRDGLIVLCRNMEEFWDSIYPELDMDDPESERYQMRLNSIAQIGEQPRKMGDKLCYVERILRAPLTNGASRSAPAYWPVWLAEAGDEVDPAELGTVEEYANRMSPDEKTALQQLVSESIEALRSLSTFLLEKTGSAYNGPFDEHLLPILEKIQIFLGSDSGAPDAGEVELAETNESGAAVATPKASAPAGSINSSADVKRALDKMIAYYRQAEPSSPLPFLLERAHKLVDADFMTIVKNLNKDSEHQFKTTLDIIDNE